jgi:hypothetical protein
MTFAQSKAGGLLVGSGAFFTSHRRQIVGLAARHALPACYGQRESVEAGGLMSYRQMPTGGQASMWAALSKARNPLICRLSSLRNSSWFSMLEPASLSASRFRRRYSRLPTR